MAGQEHVCEFVHPAAQFSVVGEDLVATRIRGVPGGGQFSLELLALVTRRRDLAFKHPAREAGVPKPRHEHGSDQKATGHEARQKKQNFGHARNRGE